MRHLGPGSTYTRGWETVRHYSQMLKASIIANVFVALFFGLLVGSAWFYSGLDREAKSHLGMYLKVSGAAWVSESRTVDYDLGNGPEKVAAGEARDVLRARFFGGRSFGFLLRQAVFRVSICVLLMALLTAFFVSRHGGRLGLDRRRRGAHVVTPREWNGGKGRSLHVTLVLFALVFGTLWFWSSLGARGRDNFGDYFWSSVYLAVAPAAALASPDDGDGIAWYAGAGEVPDGFYNNEILNHSLKIVVYDDASLLAILLGWFWRVGLLVGGSFWGRKFYSATRRNDGKNVIRLAGVDVREGTECYHMLFCGSPGSGKSTAIKELLDQVRDRGQRAVVFDTSGEYIEHYYRQGKDAILNPLDARSMHWNLWADIRTDADYNGIAKSLFPSGRDPFWTEAGAALFAATAKKLAETGQRSNRKIHHLLTTGTIEELAEFLEGTAAAKFLDERAGAMPSNLIATVTARLQAWEMLRDTPGQDAFSVREFVEDQSSDSWLFLTMRQDQEAVLRPLVSLWCEIASTSLLSMPPDRKRRFWVVLDELASLQKLPALGPLLERGRKHGAAVVLGLQSMPQLRDVYGRDAAAALASQPQTWLVLRTVEPDTARWLEHALGSAEVDETRESVSVGASNLRDGVSFQEQVRNKSVAMASEIMSLPDLHGYLKVPGDMPVFRVAFDYRERLKLASIYEPYSGEAA